MRRMGRLQSDESPVISLWNEWPARLAFGRNNNGLATTVTITMPGMGVYYGKREG